MSRSQPKIVSPVHKFFKWKGGAQAVKDGRETIYEGGRLVSYNKETEENEEMKLPFRFFVLDQLHTVTGFSSQMEKPIWSNDVSNLKKEQFTVNGTGQNIQGLWEDIKDAVKAAGGKYASSVYVAYLEGGKYVLGHIKVSGAALSSWFDYTKRYNVENGATIITDKPELDKTGQTSFFRPVFEYDHTTPEESEEAIRLDIQLQSYLKDYFSQRMVESEVRLAPENIQSDGQVPVEAYDDIDGERIDLSDIPF